LEKYGLNVPLLLINVQVKLGKTREEVETLIGRIGRENMKYLGAKFKLDEQQLFAEYYTAAAYEFYLAKDRETARYFAQKAASVFQDIPGQNVYKYDIVDALYLSGDFRSTKSYLQKKLKKDPANDELLIYLAQTEAAMGNESAALKIFAKYDTLPRLYWRRHEFQYHQNYLKARIYALLGKKEQTLALLKNALDKGQLCHYWDFGRDIFLISLFDDISFREMIQPHNRSESTIKQ
jgi:tetratricopeptide (TPR) repeat protein